MGRPSTYSEELGQKICDLVANGWALTQVVEKLGGTPTIATILDWRILIPEFGLMYTKAFDMRLQVWSEQLNGIADDAKNDWTDKTLASGATIRALDPEVAQRSRLRLDTRKWLLSKLRPEQYGDSMKLDAKVDQTTTLKVDPELLATLKELIE